MQREITPMSNGNTFSVALLFSSSCGRGVIFLYDVLFWKFCSVRCLLVVYNPMYLLQRQSGHSGTTHGKIKKKYNYFRGHPKYMEAQNAIKLFAFIIGPWVIDQKVIFCVAFNCWVNIFRVRK